MWRRTNERKALYVIIDAKTDLPCYVADTWEQARRWLGCSPATFSEMLTGVVYNAERAAKRLCGGRTAVSRIRATYKIERVIEPTDEEVENWFLTDAKECAIMG